MEWQFWLRLMTTSGIGNMHAWKLLQEFGSPEAVFRAAPAQLEALLPPRLVQALNAAPSDAFKELFVRTKAWLEQADHHILFLGHPQYPAALLEIPDPPMMLYAKGNLDYLSRPMIAVVGSRNATAQGLRHSHLFAEYLSQAGWCISSGLAAGIDAAAHQGGLAGSGGTVAVIGTGIDIVYPARNKTLAREIVEHGCIISEYSLGTGAIAANFPRRNRIISGLAKGVLVVEAVERSGSLITARMAAEQGREVFAIPGSIDSPLAKGCHFLIKQGAKLVEHPSEILEEFNFSYVPVSKQTETLGVLQRDSLLEFIGYDPISFDALLSLCQLEASELNARIFELELEGTVELLAGGLIRRLS